MRSLYRFFRSLKLTLVLLALIAVLAVAATLVPQGKGYAFYLERYGGFGAGLFSVLGFDRLFRSPLFLIPVSLLFANLAACTFGTLLSRTPDGAGGRRGTVRAKAGFLILHTGLLALVAGGAVSLAGRREAAFFLAEGESVAFASGYTLTLKSFEYQQYPDGRPRDWLSTVEIRREAGNGGGSAGPGSRGIRERPESPAARSFTIAVNRPLKLGRIKIYQNTYGETSAAVLADREGVPVRVLQGRYARSGGALVFFKRVAPASGKAVFERREGGAVTGVYEVSEGELVDGMRFQGVERALFTGLKAVEDPGFLPVVFSLVLVVSGIVVNFTQRLGTEE